MTGSYMDQALALGSAGGRPFTSGGAYFEYTKAVNPIASGLVTAVPALAFGPGSYAGEDSRVVPIDLSSYLNVAGPATSPALCANFVRLRPGDELPTAVNATSQLFYVMSGRGTTRFGDAVVHWDKGDFLTLPAGGDAVHSAASPSLLYWVHDGPLLSYLGAEASVARFEPAHYPHGDCEHWLAEVARDPDATDRNRVSILLANRAMDQTLTLTHVLWAMYGLLPEGALQPPHRHQSVALDLVLECRPGCYTLLGDLDESGERLVNIERVEWEPGTAFVTPPGRWHSHHNESGAPAHINPIQDAGLQTYLRALDIRFMGKDKAAKALPEALGVAGTAPAP